jgi:hypothetical protein
MSSIAGYLSGATALAVLGGVCLAAGVVDREIARTQENVFALKYGDSAEALDTAERYLTYGRWIPWVARRLNDVETRRASMHYWQREYDRIVPQDVVPRVAAAENVDLQLVAANAAYRKSQAAAKDRTTTLRVLDAAVTAYLGVLRHAGAPEAAAYNYEYVVRLREDIDKGRRSADLTDRAEDGPAGRQGGAPPKDADQRDLKILIPLEPGEMDKAVEPGKGTPIERKG